MQKIICYVDGYNLFHQIKDDPSANINLQALAESLVAKSKGENKLVMVHYFSAFAS